MERDRMHIGQDSPEGSAALIALDKTLDRSLGSVLFNLVKLRASQINGCGYCVDSHATALEKLGLDHRVLNAVAAWHHTTLFTPEQTVALEFTEALAGGIGEVSDELWDEAGRLLGAQRRADLVLAIGAITTWNMIGLAGRMYAH